MPIAADGVTLALDAGTGSCRAVLFDGDGAELAIAQHEWVHRSEPGIVGSQRFDTATGWTLLSACVREALATAGLPGDAVAAVATTSMREGIVLFDAAGRELWACPNVDARAGEEAAELVRSGFAQRIYELSGDWVAITSPARLLWLARHEPDLLARAASLGMLSDWMTFRLSGRHVTEPTAGSSSGLFEIARRTWSNEIVERCGLSPEVLPEVLEAGTVAGEVTPAAARQTGLAAGTPVVVGGADTQLGLVGIGVTGPGRFCVVGGSFWQSTAALDAPVVDPGGRLRTLCHAAPDSWMIEGIGFYSGLAMRWCRDAFFDAGADAYAQMEAGAADLEAGAGGVIALMSNVMQADSWRHGPPAFVGFDLNRPELGRFACARAVQEAAAYAAQSHRLIVEEVTQSPIKEAIFTGGSARGSLWPRVLCDVLGVPVRSPAVKESTSLGAALMAGVGVGLHRSLADVLPRAVRFAETLEPDLALHARYRELHERWREAYRRAMALSDDGLVAPLWRAAGT